MGKHRCECIDGDDQPLSFVGKGEYAPRMMTAAFTR